MGLARALVAATLVAACAAPLPTQVPVTTQPAPSATDQPSTAPPPSTGPTATGQPATPSPAVEPTGSGFGQHRVGVRVVDGAGEFYDRLTGERFVPRGVNVIRLAGGHHSTLDPASYDRARLDATFAQMAADGYNTARIFINHAASGIGGDGGGLSPAYMDNVADALRLADAHGMVLMFTQDWLPDSPAYGFASDPGIEDVNSLYLSTGGVEASARFFRDFARGLVERDAPLQALLAYELRNELYFTTSYPPFSLSAGSVRTANGVSYDMSSAVERRRMLEENLVAWVDRMRREILAVDATALVATGFFQPQGPNESRIGDDRIIETAKVITDSALDFIDLHGYAGGELNLRQLAENFGLPPVTEKPIMLGEFGAEHRFYAASADAVSALVGWQVESCSLGFDGWLLWTWDSAEQPEFWNAVESDGALERGLSSTDRPDPCSAGAFGGPVELAADATVRASRSIADSPPSNAIDGSVSTVWSSGDYAPQWIQLDLGSANSVSRIALRVSQYPAGATTHVLSVRRPNGDWQRVMTFKGDTQDGQWLTFEPAQPLEGIRFVRVETTRSPSWIAWFEISVLAAP